MIRDMRLSMFLNPRAICRVTLILLLNASTRALPVLSSTALIILRLPARTLLWAATTSGIPHLCAQDSHSPRHSSAVSGSRDSETSWNRSLRLYVRHSSGLSRSMAAGVLSCRSVRRSGFLSDVYLLPLTARVLAPAASSGRPSLFPGLPGPCPVPWPATLLAVAAASRHVLLSSARRARR